MENEASKSQLAASEIVGFLRAGNTIKAKNKLMGFNDEGKEGRFTVLRLLISFAQQEGDYAVARWALDIFEQMKSKAPKDQWLYYDVANGYQVLYELSVKEDPVNAFKCEDVLREAIKYFEKAGNSSALALTNFGNLYDYIGRPIEAMNYYDLALAKDKNFGMALGNKALALELLAPISGYQNTYLIHAYQLYMDAFKNEASIKEVGGTEASTIFRKHVKNIEEHFKRIGRPDALSADLSHAHASRKKMDGLAEFYTDFCLTRNLYLNMHFSDTVTDASVGDAIFPLLRTGKEKDAQQYVADIAFRFNEIGESFMAARVALTQSQYKNSDFSTISQQTTLVDNRDYSVSNIYVGHLKTAYKEAFSTLDKIAVLVNHYLGLGHAQDNVYYHNVWHEEQDDPKEAPRLLEKVSKERHLVGLYLLCQDLRGSRYSDMRNALAHRYARVYRGISGPKGTYTFEELTELTTDVMFKVKCAITYLSLFITRKEQQKHTGTSGPIMDMPLFTDQHLDIW